MCSVNTIQTELSTRKPSGMHRLYIFLLASFAHHSHQLCTDRGYDFFDGHDIPGCGMAEPNELRPAVHRNQCQDICDSIQGCTGYTWKDQVCYFKRCGRATEDDANVYSAIRCQHLLFNRLKCGLAKMIRANDNE